MGALMQKASPPNTFDHLGRSLENKTLIFLLKLEFTWFSCGVNIYFHGKTKDHEIFLDLKEGPVKICKIFICITPPQVFVNSP